MSGQNCSHVDAPVQLKEDVRQILVDFGKEMYEISWDAKRVKDDEDIEHIHGDWTIGPSLIYVMSIVTTIGR